MENIDKVASIVHSAKNRLQLIEPVLDQLHQHPDPEVRQSGDGIAQQIHEVNQQLVLMLSLYRLDHTELVGSQTLSLMDLLESAVENIRDERVQMCLDEDLTLFGDERLLRAVLGDALNNALRYCQEQVVITGMAERKGVLIRIIDDGPETPTVKSDGNGVGLWIANRIAEAHRNGVHRGFARYRFDESLGSCFELHLP